MEHKQSLYDLLVNYLRAEQDLKAGQEFWREMARVLPEYQRCQEWLGENAARLSL